MFRGSVCLFIAALVSCFYRAQSGTFSVDYGNRQFLKDGKPFRYISGSIHYFRVHPDQWNDRLQRIRALGFNAVQVYVAWNFHEEFQGKFDFTGHRNLSQFLSLAQQNGLNVLLRPGPYICAEWEFGGFPYWLLKYNGIKLRTYINAVQNYYNVLLGVIEPHLYKNGGSILMIQVENEYGYAGACNHEYTSFLRDLIWNKLGSDVVLYTTDGAGNGELQCGAVNGTLTTVDFSSGDSDTSIDGHFTIQDKYNHGGPHVCSEYWINWYVTWGQSSGSSPNPPSIIDHLNHMYSNWNASFNIYMIFGGTHFDFWAGSDGPNGPPMVTSYDYGAAIAENGDITPTYQAIHSFIGNLTNWEQPPQPIPKNNPSTAFGQVPLKRLGHSLITTIAQIQETCQNFPDPTNFEQLDHPYGFVLYSTTLSKAGTALVAPNIRDYGYVYVNNNYQGMLSRDGPTSLTISSNSGDVLKILVENRGREKIGAATYDQGLHDNVTLDGGMLKNWYECGINLTRSAINGLTSNNVQQMHEETGPEAASVPGVYVGQFAASQMTDTWFDSTGWGKGVLFVNGHNMGRYWPLVGPQVAIYVPKPYIQETNTVVLLEMVGSQQTTANFIDHALYKYKNSL